VFQHELPFNRSSLTRWRQRLGGGRSRRVCWRAYRWHTEQLRTGSQPVVGRYHLQEKLDCLSDRRSGSPHGTIGKPVGLARRESVHAPELSAPSQTRQPAAIAPVEVSISGVAGSTVSSRTCATKTSDRFGSLFDSGAAGSPSRAAFNADRKSTCSLRQMNASATRL
jgi:hypothetical protein